jgi:hypothetical protein
MGESPPDSGIRGIIHKSPKQRNAPRGNIIFILEGRGRIPPLVHHLQNSGTKYPFPAVNTLVLVTCSQDRIRSISPPCRIADLNSHYRIGKFSPHFQLGFIHLYFRKVRNSPLISENCPHSSF